MNDESIYGLVFKKIREDRGITQKEAAGTTVTPHFLRQFEQGKSRITIQKFEEIIDNVGIDKETFDKIRAQMFPTEFHKRQVEVANLVSKREYKKALDLLNQPLEDSGIAEHFIIANRVVSKFGIASIVGDSLLTPKDYEELEYIKAYLTKVEYWNYVEVNVFSAIISHFSIEFLDYRLYHLLDVLKKQTEYHYTRASEYYLAALRAGVKNYSIQGHYDKAEKLAQKTLEVMNAFPELSMKLTQFIALSMERSCNFLRQNDVYGLELTKHIFATLDHLEKTSQNQLLIRLREDFFSKVTQLNKTGQPLEQ